MPSVDMFDTTFTIADPMKATGKIKYEKEAVDFLCACIIQLDDHGEIAGGAYGAATEGAVQIDNDDDHVPASEKQPTWKLPMRMMPNTDGKSRKLQAGVPATGLALYRRDGAQLEIWVTSNIEVEA